MYVYDGDSTSAPEIASLTGTLPDELMSTGRDIFINFISDDSETTLGFRIQFDTSKKIFNLYNYYI